MNVTPRCPTGYCARSDGVQRIWQDGIRAFVALMVHFLLLTTILLTIWAAERIIRALWGDVELVWLRDLGVPVHVTSIFEFADLVLLCTFLLCGVWLFLTSLLGRE